MAGQDEKTIEQQPESKVMALKQEIGARKTALLHQLFDASWAAGREAERIVQDAVASSKNSTPELQQKIYMQEAEASARGMRQSALEEYTELELLEQAGIEEIGQEAR